jgi:hypothetical protein
MGTAAARVDELMARFSVRRRELFSAELPAHAVEIRPFAIATTSAPGSTAATRKATTIFRSPSSPGRPRATSARLAANGCRLKRSGNMPRAAGRPSNFLGARRYPMAPSQTGRQPACTSPHLSRAFRRPPAGCTTWPEMCGSSSQIGGAMTMRAHHGSSRPSDVSSAVAASTPRQSTSGCTIATAIRPTAPARTSASGARDRPLVLEDRDGANRGR